MTALMVAAFREGDHSVDAHVGSFVETLGVASAIDWAVKRWGPLTDEQKVAIRPLIEDSLSWDWKYVSVSQKGTTIKIGAFDVELVWIGVLS